MIKKFSIKIKFFLIALPGACAILLLSFLAFDITNKSVTNVNNVFEDAKRVQNIQQLYISPLFQLREKSLSLVMAPNEDLRKNISIELQKQYKMIDFSFSKLSSDLYQQWYEYLSTIQLSEQYLNEDFEEGAFINASILERDLFYKLLSTLETLQKNELMNSANTYEEVNIQANNTKSLIIIWLIVIIFLTFLPGSFIAKNIVNSIEKVKNGLNQFFDYLQTPTLIEAKHINIPFINNDELGEMAQQINKNIKIIQDNLDLDRKLIEDATDVMYAIKQGDLDRRLVASAHALELNLLKAMMNEMLQRLNHRIEEEIIERTKQEQLLIQQSKLAAMGNMIGNIAHQWRQPLSEINAVLMIIQVRYQFNDFSEDFLNEKIDECNQITTHMSNTINDFQNFFKPSKQKDIFDINESCKNASSILQASLKYHSINFTFSSSDQAYVFGYPNEFAHALLNILSNAKDVLIERKIANPYIFMEVKCGHKFVLIKIQDNGGGIKQEYMERIFEPYFTTKHARKGTGIGLYMTKMIIETNMNGIIIVQNINDGVLFTIKLRKTTQSQSS